MEDLRAITLALMIAVILIVALKKVLPRADIRSHQKMIGGFEVAIFLLVLTGYLVTEAMRIAHHLRTQTLLEFDLNMKDIGILFIVMVASVLLYLGMVYLATKMQQALARSQSGRKDGSTGLW